MGFAEDGFAVVEGVASDWEVDRLLAAVSVQGNVYAIRNLLELVPEVRAWANSPACRRLVEPILGSRARAVRGILFDKTPDANWKVPWHQDLTIAVQERVDIPGYGPWTAKAGVPHVQPPVAVLEQMVAVRLHLDDCGADNGPVRVLRGSHRWGRLTEVPMHPGDERACTVRRGGVLLMRPLLWHACRRPCRHRIAA